MEAPVRITFRGMTAPDALTRACEREVAKLERFAGRITSCDVVVERPRYRTSRGAAYEVRLHVKLPGIRIAVTHVPPVRADGRGLAVALRRAFDGARRELQDAVRVQRGAVKAHTLRGRRRVTPRRA
jgi:ribosome-associated translation inhibitor RaiA